jgi:membrane protein YqaA with SNARE-associated domain
VATAAAMIDPATTAAFAGLFLSSAMAATILPLGSESVVIAMAVAGYSPAGILVVATAGNSLGAVVNYGIGLLGERAIHQRYTAADLPALNKAQQILKRWGPPVLIFAWAPVIGDPLTLLAGLAAMPFARFFFWMCLGKGLRYALLLAATGQIQAFFG